MSACLSQTEIIAQIRRDIARGPPPRRVVHPNMPYLIYVCHESIKSREGLLKIAKDVMNKCVSGDILGETSYTQIGAYLTEEKDDTEGAVILLQVKLNGTTCNLAIYIDPVTQLLKDYFEVVKLRGDNVICAGVLKIPAKNSSNEEEFSKITNQDTCIMYGREGVDMKTKGFFVARKEQPNETIVESIINGLKECSHNI